MSIQDEIIPSEILWTVVEFSKTGIL